MLEQIMQQNEIFEAPAWLKEQANLLDLEGEWARSLADPEAFWGGWASRGHGVRVLAHLRRAHVDSRTLVVHSSQDGAHQQDQ